MINYGLPMATPDMAQISNAVGNIPADPQETMLRQYLQQLEAQGRAGTPQYFIAGGELQNRENMRQEAQANQAAGVQQQPPVMQQLAQPPQQMQMPQPAASVPDTMRAQFGATPAVQPGIMQMAQAGGIETLPAENLQNIENYAGGGIVAFDEGGEVPGYALGGRIKALLGLGGGSGSAVADPSVNQSLQERINELADKNIETIPSDFFGAGGGGGARSKILQAIKALTQKQLAQDMLNKEISRRRDIDVKDYFARGVGIDEEDVKKYGLAGGGIVSFNTGGASNKSSSTPTMDRLAASLGAEPDLNKEARQLEEFYKAQGINLDPYGKAVERARADMGSSDADKNRLLWETMLGIGTNLAIAPSKQTNKRAQFFENVAYGLDKGTQKLPEGLRELNKAKKERAKALEDLELAQNSFKKGVTDAKVQRYDEAKKRYDNISGKIAEFEVTKDIAATKLAAEKSTNDRAAATKLAATEMTKRLANDPSLAENPDRYEQEYDFLFNRFLSSIEGSKKAASSGQKTVSFTEALKQGK